MSAITAKASRKMKKYAVLTREPRCFLGSFDFSWEQRKLSELTSMHARIGWQNLRTSEFLDSGNYMLITGTDFNDGAINFSTCHYVERERYEQDRNIQIHNGSILITKDGTLGKVAYVQGLSMPATLNAGVFNVQIKDANNVDEKYLFQYLKAPFLMDYVDKKATGGTIKHLNQSILVDFPVILPQRSEQTLIGAFFQQLDNLITLHQRKCALLFSPFQALISMMFTTSTFSWEQRKFSDITFPAGEKNRDNLPLESYSITNEHGFVPQDEKFENGGTMREADKRMYYIVSPNSFAYNPARINVGSIGYQNIGKNVIVSSLYEVFKTSEDVDDRLLWHWFKSPDFQKLIMQLQEGGVRLYFYYDKLCMGEVSLPSLEEQRKIGKLFDTLDNLITLHQRKYDKLTNVKKSMLEKMFPKNGSNVPEIRFKGFSDAWEQRKLGDCFTERVESMPDGELISVTINDGIKKFSELGRHDNSNDDKSKYKKVCVGDIAYNSMRMWQGASGYSSYEGIVSPAYTVLSPNSGINSKCLAYQFKLPEMIHTFQVNSQGITSDNWNLKYPVLSKIEIFVSKDEQEQAKIAEYFENLDNLITLHQRELEKLKNLKKACLEKMFV